MGVGVMVCVITVASCDVTGGSIGSGLLVVYGGIVLYGFWYRSIRVRFVVFVGVAGQVGNAVVL